MNTLLIDSPCYDLQKITGGFLASDVRRLKKINQQGEIVQNYKKIKHLSDFCVDESRNLVGVLDTSGRFFSVDINSDTMQKFDKKEQYESRKPFLIDNKMFWVQLNGIVRKFDIKSGQLSQLAVIEPHKHIHVRGFTHDKNNLYVLFSYPPKLRTFFAAVSLQSGEVNIKEFPFRFPKELDKICIFDGKFLCLRERRKALFLISSKDLSLVKKIKFSSKLGYIIGLLNDTFRNEIYIWGNSAVIKINMYTLEKQTVFQDQDQCINSVSVSDDGTVCIGTWEKGIVLYPD